MKNTVREALALDATYTRLLNLAPAIRAGGGDLAELKRLLDSTVPASEEERRLAFMTSFLALNCRGDLIHFLFKTRRACLLLLVDGPAAAAALGLNEHLDIRASADGTFRVSRLAASAAHAAPRAMTPRRSSTDAPREASAPRSEGQAEKAPRRRRRGGRRERERREARALAASRPAMGATEYQEALAGLAAPAPAAPPAGEVSTARPAETPAARPAETPAARPAETAAKPAETPAQVASRTYREALEGSRPPVRILARGAPAETRPTPPAARAAPAKAPTPPPPSAREDAATPGAASVTPSEAAAPAATPTPDTPPEGLSDEEILDWGEVSDDEPAPAPASAPTPTPGPTTAPPAQPASDGWRAPGGRRSSPPRRRSPRGERGERSSRGSRGARPFAWETNRG